MRTSWLYGVHGNNFVKTILRLAGEGDELKIVSDQYGCPTWTESLSEALAALAGRINEAPSLIPWGTFHYCDGGATSRWGFARAVLRSVPLGTYRKTIKVVPIKTCDYPTPAKRPTSSVLDCTKIQHAFGIRPRHWHQSLKAILEKLFFTPDFPTIPERNGKTL